MSLILNGTTGISDVDGTAAAPALTGTDSNTGIFFPAADQVATTVGGTEGMRLTSTGLGVGTSSPDARLTIRSGGDAEISLKDSGGTTRAYIGTAGAFGSAPTGALRLRSDQGGIVFGFAGSEQMRIDSSGNLLVGTTSGDLSATSFGIALRTPSGGQQIRVNTSGATDTNIAVFRTNGSDVFRVATNGGIANFQANDSNLSDRREKTNFAPAKSYLETICAIPVQTFNFIHQDIEAGGGSTLGVVAQDVQAVAPELVLNSNWGTKDEPKMRLSIYQTDLQYALMKCIQEQQALITALTTRITALEAI